MAEILLEEQVVEFGLDSEESTEYVGVVAGNKGFEVGSTYVVVWDGVAYESKCVDIQGMPVIGNTSAFTGIPSDLPFLIYHDASDAQNPVYIFATEDTAETHTIEVYSGTIEEEIPEENTGVTITLYDRTGAAVNYDNVETITTDTPDAEQGATFTYGVAVENAEYEPDFVNGNQKVTLEKGQLLKEFTMVKPETLLAENIKKGVKVAGVEGTLIGEGVSKTIEDLNFTEGNHVVLPDTETLLSEVVIVKPDGLEPENVAEDEVIAGIKGTAKLLKIGMIANRTISGAHQDTEVTSLIPNAFDGFSLITSLAFPACTSVGSGAFSGCTSLESVVLNEAYSYINPYTFAGTGMKNASFPNVTAMLSNAFCGCKNLETAYLPKAQPAAYAFSGCTNLTEVHLGSGSEYLNASSYMFAGCSNLKTIKTYYSGSEITPEFKNYDCFPGVFSGCNNLENGYLTSTGYTVIGSYQFYNCSKLKALCSVSTAVQQIGNVNVANATANASLSTYPGIGANAFYGCIGLTQLSFKFLFNVCIKESAFCGCTNLSRLYIGTSNLSYSSWIVSLPSYVFDNTPFSKSTYLGYYGSIYVPSSYFAWFKTRPGWSKYSARMVSF